MMLQVRQLSVVTSHPCLPFCRHIIPTLHLENVFGLISENLYPCNYLSWECGLYKASDLHTLECFPRVEVLCMRASCIFPAGLDARLDWLPLEEAARQQL